MSDQVETEERLFNIEFQENNDFEVLDKFHQEQNVRHRKKKEGKMVDYSASKVRMFFEDAGFDVKDQRSVGGALWIIGNKEALEPFINEACEKFGISGSYSSSKATGFKPGWYTKTKQ